jgi:hypothetical protein
MRYLCSDLTNFESVIFKYLYAIHAIKVAVFRALDIQITVVYSYHCSPPLSLYVPQFTEEQQIVVLCTKACAMPIYSSSGTVSILYNLDGTCAGDLEAHVLPLHPSEWRKSAWQGGTKWRRSWHFAELIIRLTLAYFMRATNRGRPVYRAKMPYAAKPRTNSQKEVYLFICARLRCGVCGGREKVY